MHNKKFIVNNTKRNQVDFRFSYTSVLDLSLIWTKLFENFDGIAIFDGLLRL